MPLPYGTAAANAAHVSRTLVDTYLITHPHMDHISGFVVNTAGLPGTRPKKLAGLPSTIQAFKNHVFNNVIWPNLSDENNGAGLLTYLRLVDGGSPALGDGAGKGYLEVCDGLLVKTWGVSHGHCIERHSHRGSASSASPRFGSHDATAQPPRRDVASRAQTLLGQATLAAGPSPFADQETYCVYDSSAYFIRDHDHRREVLIFGDVEPDSLSLSPRNLAVWQDAAPKVANGTLAAVFIECSYDDSRANDRLFGHLKPVFVIEELRALAAEVEAARNDRGLDSRKRKCLSLGPDTLLPRRHPSLAAEEPVSPKSMKPCRAKSDTPHMATPVDELTIGELEPPRPDGDAHQPLEGLKVVIIHVKETLENEPDPGQTILEQLRQHDQEARLGCEFIISKAGQSFYF